MTKYYKPHKDKGSKGLAMTLTALTGVCALIKKRNNKRKEDKLVISSGKTLSNEFSGNLRDNNNFYDVSYTKTLNTLIWELRAVNEIETEKDIIYEFVLVNVLTGFVNKRLFSKTTPYGLAYLEELIKVGDQIRIQSPQDIQKNGFDGIVLLEKD